MKLIPNEEQPA